MKKYEVIYVAHRIDSTDIVDADGFDVKQGVLFFYKQGTHTQWLIQAYNDWQSVKQIREEGERPAFAPFALSEARARAIIEESMGDTSV